MEMQIIRPNPTCIRIPGGGFQEPGCLLALYLTLDARDSLGTNGPMALKPLKTFGFCFV